MYTNKICGAVPREKKWFPDSNWTNLFTSTSSLTPHSMKQLWILHSISWSFYEDLMGEIFLYSRKKSYSEQNTWFVFIWVGVGGMWILELLLPLQQWRDWGQTFAGFMTLVAPSLFTLILPFLHLVIPYVVLKAFPNPFSAWQIYEIDKCMFPEKTPQSNIKFLVCSASQPHYKPRLKIAFSSFLTISQLPILRAASTWA